MKKNKFTIDGLRSFYSKEDNNSNSESRGPNRYFNFWDMPNGSQCVIRFLPDLDDENPMGFVVEKRNHKLTVNGKNRTVPCNAVHGEACPICAASQAYYKSGDEVNGKKYWRKASYVAQALIVESSVPVKAGEEDPTGKVKLISIGYSIWKIIKDAFESGDLDDVPFDYTDGCDFVIKKDMQGAHASYVLSRFARKTTALSDEQIAEIEPQLIELKSILSPVQPVEKIEGLLEADLTGAPYNDDRSAQSPAPANTPAPQESAPADTPAPSAGVDESAAQEPATPAASDAGASQEEKDAQDKANEVIAQIKRRRAGG